MNRVVCNHKWKKVCMTVSHNPLSKGACTGVAYNPFGKGLAWVLCATPCKRRFAGGCMKSPLKKGLHGLHTAPLKGVVACNPLKKGLPLRREFELCWTNQNATECSVPITSDIQNLCFRGSTDHLGDRGQSPKIGFPLCPPEPLSH